ncbi:hypothetical protein [Paenibacillus harenae]|uniref:hypothetical protein n=1 Tax=Paenibacillus harenae TaxID=306543 RepID=UPI00041D75BF|nr:hypothetical protein [Paenibacillus harenae]
MDFPLTYLEWSEQDRRVVRTVAEAQVSCHDVFVRKLVNATAYRNRLYEHTANECEDGTRHHVYVKPFKEDDDAVYGQAISAALHEYCTVSPRMEAEFLLWNGYRFNPCTLGQPSPESPLAFAQLLLDHYIVSQERAYETIYTIYDMDRSKIVVFLKGADQ